MVLGTDMGLEIEVLNFPNFPAISQFFAISCNFPQFFRNFFRPVQVACLLVPFASVHKCCRMLSLLGRFSDIL